MIGLFPGNHDYTVLLFDLKVCRSRNPTPAFLPRAGLQIDHKLPKADVLAGAGEDLGIYLAAGSVDIAPSAVFAVFPCELSALAEKLRFIRVIRLVHQTVKRQAKEPAQQEKAYYHGAQQETHSNINEAEVAEKTGSGNKHYCKRKDV